MDDSETATVPLMTGLNAHRAPQPPLRSPSYVFSQVPKATKDLSGSILQEVKDRDHFKACMSEMVLLCNEAIRRNSLKKCKSKPLSLEYIADRLDVDDPCFGYLARSNEGKLQGFITLTTFTNWQKNFRWDSKNEASFYYDDDDDDDDANEKEKEGNDQQDEEGIKSEEEEEEDEAEFEDKDDDDDESYAGEGRYHTPIPSRKRKNTKPESAKKQPSTKKPKQEETTAETKKPPKKARKIDLDGSLAQELENTVRLGDPYNEGIVWPRIAEVSLLGALGCGKQLLKLAIEQLEFQKPSANANYDYLVLQATDNSIGFYESIGFVRVGAVTFGNDDKKNQSTGSTDTKTPSKSTSDSTSGDSSSVGSVTDTSMESNGSGVVVAEPLAPSSPDKQDALARPSRIVSSPLEVHIVKQGGWTPKDIAARHKVDPWDVVFLNRDIYPSLTVHSKLKKGTTLFVPKSKTDALHAASSPQAPTQEETPTKWFVAKENDTPRKIAKMHGVPCTQLVQANVARLPELQAASRLKEGTRVKVNNFDKPDNICQQYCHWSFPDDASVENGEPSYMMVYKVERKSARAPRDVRNSLAAKVQPYQPPPLLMEAPKTQKVVTKKRRNLPRPPVPPPQPPSGFNVFQDHQKQLYPELRDSNAANRQLIKGKWDLLSKLKQSRYEDVAKDCAKHFDDAQAKFEKAYAKWKDDCDKLPLVETVLEKDDNLFSKVVKLRDDALEGKQYTYWFVLTYIPDLKWCHLAPMVPDGVFGPERKRSHGRTRWRLVDESLGHELDISSVFCIPVRSRTLKKTADADKEEWDVLDGTSNGVAASFSSDKSSEGSPTTSADEKPPPKRAIRKQPVRPRSATKPMSGKIAVKSSATPNKKVLASPARSTRSNRTTDSPRSFPSPRRILSPGRPEKATSSPIRQSAVKRKATQDLDPERKARTIKTVGGRRSVLQS
ncbi:unnamed protein product [Cylindrotheca closterium]|uniref:HMG box domain-containing protein n=1 Tax=Cylindrotheca closterium TaxID=2856 RepID=A0AAD2FLP5_9STRA|nr:unnamed protein product [Cylindrotheca closterium]